ncbi:MAG TPA: mandelate racemase/muconate lactonizing enzyme family protein [Candidatus Binatia bacterium]|jgi:L-alanine-DL-glutamate epimerase-like enolase superfamily enzyme|nr:mandelate racemase/muconate lactonizing enzyme family protein [Candidatus Binatia bacterium]
MTQWPNQQMKIIDLQVIPLAIPLRHETPESPWAAGLGRQIIVQVHTDTGISGLGEAFAYGAPLAVCAVLEELKPLLLGADPTQPELLYERLSQATLLYGRRGLGLFALSAIDIALWDIVGKVKKQPLYKLLGGNESKRLPAYISLLRYQTPPEVARVIVRCLEAGFQAVKLHQIDVKSVSVAREVAGERVNLMLDVNCPWNAEEALAMAKTLARYRLTWLEEPVWPPDDYPSLAQVRREAGIPIASGENEGTVHGFANLLAQGAADILQPSVTKVGGVSEWRRIAALAAQHGKQVAAHSFYFGPGFAATLHLMAALPGCTYTEVAGCALAAPLVQEPFDFGNGTVGVPEGPGLGVTLNQEVVKKYPYSAVSGSLNVRG